MDTLDLVRIHPAAFNALPEPYQADNCLTFFRDVNGALICAPKKGQEDILGYWEAMYDPTCNEWVSVQ